MMLIQRRYAYDLACYPEKKDKIDLEYNELNKTSIATKFLLEYIAAIPPEGNEPISEYNYEYLLTICSLIIEWAHNSDMFKYKMIDNDLTLLKSGRIGLEKNKIENLAKDNYDASRKRLNAISNPYIELYMPHQIISNEEMDSAFKNEFSYTYSELYVCIMELINIGDSISSEVKRKPLNDIYDMLTKSTGLSQEKIVKIIDDFSLSKRANFMAPDPPFTKSDVSPWKFNRRLSFLRRPITRLDNDLIWGNRQVYHSLVYLYDLVVNGKIPVTKGGYFDKYIGKLINKRGNDFNTVVANKLKNFDTLIVDSKVKKINKKRIANEKGQDLGDIDVLAIIPSRKKIVVIEVKDFAFAKSPYEMYMEYQNVFCDKKKELCCISRHKRRVEWVEKHLTDVKEHYKLSGEGWKICEMMVVDEDIISKDFYHEKQKIILFTDLSHKLLYKL